ncbi:MAG: hypothetical protein CMM48_18545 [Rhodospirillaceae bacterium]|nr:hypothetical protein [Rhodospirillaceae bacterium]
MDDLLQEFLAEADEALEALDGNLVKLERAPNDRKILDEIFRLVHTAKGTSGFLGLSRLEALAHATEDLLGQIRDGKRAATSSAISLILEALDGIKSLLAALHQTETEPAGDDRALIDRIQKFADLPTEAVTEPEAQLEAAIVEKSDDPVGLVEELGETDEGVAGFPDRNIEEKIKADPPPPVRVQNSGVRTTTSRPAKGSLRVDETLLDRIAELVSDLGLTRNRLIQASGTVADNDLAEPLKRLSEITADLQDSVQRTRRRPIGDSWAGLPRMVRDFSIELGKRIDLEMIGAETEVERRVLAQMRDPLVHMVRNSGDHGIELPQDRQAAGKPEAGRITLRAFQDDSNIVLQIGDDGRGFETERIGQKAVALGLISAAELASLGEDEIHDFVFEPGLSTALSVTAISGRGVGMDVVRDNVEELGGTVELESVAGEGMTATLRIPLSDSIGGALVVASGGIRFALPQNEVVDTLSLNNGSGHRLEDIDSGPVLVMPDDRRLPVIRLNEMLKINTPVSGDGTVIVTNAGEAELGILVDNIEEKEQFAIHPVPPVLRHLDVFSGVSVRADGSVVLMLDTAVLARR